MTNLPAGWIVDHGHLKAGRVDVGDIVGEFGTPLYLYNGEIVAARGSAIRAAFPGFQVFYAMKANPNPNLCSLVAGLGFKVGVSSIGELDSALAAGFASDATAFVGPSKSRAHLADAVDRGLGTTILESVRELHDLELIGAARNTTLNATLRINTRYRPPVAGELMGGTPSQFGIDEDLVATQVSRVPHPHVSIQGIHAFVASQVLDPDFLTNHVRRTANLAIELSRNLDFDLRSINFGGGFGVPYGPSDHPLDLASLGDRIASVLDSAFPETAHRPEFQLEVGRHLVAEAGVFFTEVVDVKQSRGRTFVVTNSGISGFSRPAMPWAQQHPCSILGKFGNRPTGSYTVVGPTCMPSDVLCSDAELPDPTPGDIIVLHNAGAYGYTMSLLLWGSHRMPAEVLYDGERVSLTETRISAHEGRVRLVGTPV